MIRLKYILLLFLLTALVHHPAQGQTTALSLPSPPPTTAAIHTWNGLDYKGNRWVNNLSRPYAIKNGLVGRHLFISPSHGRYFNGEVWKWQRPTMFCTAEDLLTQSFVFPYLIPMLENAGAIVYSPRERDPQDKEAVVDNDHPGLHGNYDEWNTPKHTWQTTSVRGFALPLTTMNDLTMPFQMGTARYVATTQESGERATATWTPQIPTRGHYAVYVSYPTLSNSVSDARYTVHHAGGTTTFRVNQRIGGGTWLYLGTFLFEAGRHESGRVVLHNESRHKGVVTADAVRFGGGRGLIERSVPSISYTPDSVKVFNYPRGLTSGLPRQLEGARYYAQWAGLPDTLYNKGEGSDDYSDDIRSRSHLLNFLSGGSAFVPDTVGRGVPFELAFALHTDAGFNREKIPFGTLGIVTGFDDRGDSLFRTGVERAASKEFAALVMQQLLADLSRSYAPNWSLRELRDRNYGETRSPLVPSMILELLAHQNYADMVFAHDPNFKFTASRAIYKAMLRHVSRMHGKGEPVVQPLPVHAFSAQLIEGKAQVRLSWQPTIDEVEPSANATEYIVYARTEEGGFDNGTLTEGKTSVVLPLTPGQHRIFRVAAINAGGESFPSQPLSVYCPEEKSSKSKHILIVNAFNRLSGPARIETPDSLGFDVERDWGVPYLYTTALAGKQTNFSTEAMGKEGPTGLGYGTSEWVGQRLAGNAFDGVEHHASAIRAALPSIGISSISSEAFARLSPADLARFDLIDYVCGLERDAPHNLRPYKTFPPQAQQLLRAFARRGGHLLVSGSFVGSDMQAPAEREFLRNVLRVEHQGSVANDTLATFYGLQLDLPIYHRPCAQHFACTHTDVLVPTVKEAFSAFAYGKGGYSAGVAYPGRKGRVITMGFPFECIADPHLRSTAMHALLRFLLP